MGFLCICKPLQNWREKTSFVSSLSKVGSRRGCAKDTEENYHDINIIMIRTGENCHKKAIKGMSLLNELMSREIHSWSLNSRQTSKTLFPLCAEGVAQPPNGKFHIFLIVYGLWLRRRVSVVPSLRCFVSVYMLYVFGSVYSSSTICPSTPLPSSVRLLRLHGAPSSVHIPRSLHRSVCHHLRRSKFTA